jgi:S-adenosylmethionine:tRNA ribosyltransferase-isomerase
MRVDAFDYALPPDRIATRPVEPRDAARLLVVADAPIDDRVARLPALLAPGDLLVCNDTRVIPARLHGRRGAVAVEATLLRQTAAGSWQALVRPARRLRPGHTITWAPGFTAELAARGDAGEVELRFDRAGAALDAALAHHGSLPLPPYIARQRGNGRADDRDRSDYQTIFARRAGAVAAPTAGLHFTDNLLAALAARGIGRVAVTLHVGAGTFLPVRTTNAEDHPIHTEWGEISEDAARAINTARAGGGRIVAVGTTALRLLESAADPAGAVQPFAGETRLFILPGYRFKAVDLLLTNFHLPRSTLLMLVAAFTGLERIKAAYAHAIAAGYRFYSYGDACLLFPGGGR